MGIPEARKRLIEISDDIALTSHRGALAVRAVVQEEMHRRPAVRKAPKRAAPPTPAQRVHVRELALRYPEWPYTRIAQHTGLNIGRISEILNPPEKAS